MVRGTWHEPTRRHVARRIGEGNSEREIRRCRKRTVARRLFRPLARNATPRLAQAAIVGGWPCLVNAAALEIVIV
jgi:hypothetical protein